MPIMRYDVNEFGTRVSVHICRYCGDEFTVCPAIPVERESNFEGCLAVGCPSYDPERDVDKLFDNGADIYHE